jgi:hypothetical protein
LQKKQLKTQGRADQRNKRARVTPRLQRLQEGLGGVVEGLDEERRGGKRKKETTQKGKS